MLTLSSASLSLSLSVLSISAANRTSRHPISSSRRRLSVRVHPQEGRIYRNEETRWERERERERWIHRSFLRGESLGRNNRVCEARGKTNRFERMEGRKVFWYCLREPGRLIKYWILSMKYRRKHPPPPSFPVDEKFERFSVNFSSILRFELLTSTFRYFGGWILSILSQSRAYIFNSRNCWTSNLHL